MRDGSLSMRTFLELNDLDYSRVKSKMEQYLNWVVLLQSKTDPHDQDVRAEPKFLIPSVI
jgi:hypothetical protein